jgi:hypothetical protein
VAWAEREREQGCAKWDGEASAGTGGAKKGAGVRGRATWPGAGKAELIGRSHGAARKRERARGGGGGGG